jgi:hypothetical protein
VLQTSPDEIIAIPRIGFRVCPQVCLFVVYVCVCGCVCVFFLFFFGPPFDLTTKCGDAEFLLAMCPQDIERSPQHLQTSKVEEKSCPHFLSSFLQDLFQFNGQKFSPSLYEESQIKFNSLSPGFLSSIFLSPLHFADALEMTYGPRGNTHLKIASTGSRHYHRNDVISASNSTA